MAEFIYRGAREGSKGIIYRYDRVGADPEAEGSSIYFKRKLKRPFHRIGDVITLTEDKGKAGSFRTDGGVVRHVDSPEDEALDVAARQAHAQEAAAKKLASRSDLDEALEPLRRAYQRSTEPARAALLSWAIRKIQSWR